MKGINNQIQCCFTALFSDSTLAVPPEDDARFRLEKETVLKVTFNIIFYVLRCKLFHFYIVNCLDAVRVILTLASYSCVGLFCISVNQESMQELEEKQTSLNATSQPTTSSRRRTHSESGTCRFVMQSFECHDKDILLPYWP